MHVLNKILELTRPYRLRIFGGIGLSLMVSGITAAIAWSIKPAIDEIWVGKRYEFFSLLAIGIFMLFSLRGWFIFCQTYLMRSAGMKLVRETRNKLYDHILRLPVGYFNEESSGVIVSRVMLDADALNGLVSEVIKAFIVETPTVIFLLGIAFYRKWDLTLASLVLLPLVAYSTRKFGKGVKRKRKEAQRKLSFLTHRINESILGSRVIKVFNREETMRDKFVEENRRYYREFLRVIRLKEFTRVVIDMVTGAGIAAVLAYGGVMIKNGVITTGDFVSLLAAIYLMFSPIKRLGEAYSYLQESRASIERIDTLQDAEPEKQGLIPLNGFSKSIKFEDVSFRFPGNETPVLTGVSFEILCGEVVAIVGRSGVGKSTLVDLIPKFHVPSSGVVAIDGIDLYNIELSSLRHKIGIVSQDVVLFNDTVGENIAFGKSGASEAEVVEAARMAYADEFIQQLPQKYDTLIGDRGLKLSGGQRQRIAIARAVLKNPPILILDEATSSLDSVSEALVQNALEVLMRGRTTIVIAHRLSTIKHSDRILIIEKGKIQDIGKHEDLINRSLPYKELYNVLS